MKSDHQERLGDLSEKLNRMSLKSYLNKNFERKASEDCSVIHNLL